MTKTVVIQADLDAAERLAENLGVIFGPVALQGVRAAFARHRIEAEQRR